MVDVDALGVDAERREGVALDGQFLGGGGDSGVADQEVWHTRKYVPLGGVTRGIFSGGSYGDPSAPWLLAPRMIMVLAVGGSSSGTPC